MANLLADPGSWKSWHTSGGDYYYAGPPSEYWDAATNSYYYYAAEYGSSQVSMLLVPNAQAGDVLAGEFEALTISGVTGAPTTLTGYDAKGTAMWAISGIVGERIAFSHPAVTGMQLATAIPDPSQFLYTGESRIYIPQSPVPPTPTVGACKEIGRATRNYVSAYQRDRVFRSSICAAEKRQLITNFSGAIPRCRSIVSATWQTWDTVNCCMASPAINGREVQIMVTAQYAGHCRIRVDVTLDNGEVYSAWHVIRVQPAPYFNNPGWVTGPSSLTVSV